MTDIYQNYIMRAALILFALTLCGESCMIALERNKTGRAIEIFLLLVTLALYMYTLKGTL